MPGCKTCEDGYAVGGRCVTCKVPITQESGSVTREICEHGQPIETYCDKCDDAMVIDKLTGKPMTDIPGSPFKVGKIYPTVNGYRVRVHGALNGELLVSTSLINRKEVPFSRRELCGECTYNPGLSLIPPVTYEYRIIRDNEMGAVWISLGDVQLFVENIENYNCILRREVGTDNITLIKKGEDLE